MRHDAITSSITVTIGRHTRIYFAFVTTAPVVLDSPGTMTLHTSTFGDLVGFAAESGTYDALSGPAPARLVLIDAMELAWQRAKYRGSQHRLLATDPVLFGLTTLQHWLWQRLRAPLPGEGRAA